MSSILALPAPSSLPATTTTGRARALLASDATAVTAIRAVPDETRRQQLRQATENQQVDGDGQSGGARGVYGDRSGQGAAATGQGRAGAFQDQPQTAAPARAASATQNAGPSAGFVTQSLYQESIGAGLHIEPWSQALGAYRRADSMTDSGAGTAAARPRANITV